MVSYLVDIIKFLLIYRHLQNTYWFKGGAYIYVMRRDNIVERRFIELGPEVGNQVVVERGLAAKENIVTEGFHKLTPGMKVNPVKPTANTTQK